MRDYKIVNDHFAVINGEEVDINSMSFSNLMIQDESDKAIKEAVRHFLNFRPRCIDSETDSRFFYSKAQLKDFLKQYKNKKGDIIFKNFCFTNKDEEYSALEKAIEWYATNPDSQLDNSFYKIMVKNEIGEGSTYNTTTMKVLAREEYVNQVSEVYNALEREKGFWEV